MGGRSVRAELTRSKSPPDQRLIPAYVRGAMGPGSVAGPAEQAAHLTQPTAQRRLPLIDDA